MPVLPIPFYSNYYLVEINFAAFFSNLGIVYSGPPGSARLIASKFDISHSNNASPKTAIQGKPGTLIQDVPTPYFEYTLEAPLVINAYPYPGYTNFLAYNSLNYLALKWANWQWQQIHGYNTSLLGASDFHAVLTEYSINSHVEETTQTLKFRTNQLLSTGNITGLEIEAFTIAQLPTVDPSGYIDASNYVGRIAKNYDMFADMYFPNNGYYLTTGTPLYPNDIYLDSMDFSIKFDVDNKVFLNTQNTINFLIKNYSLSQKFGVTGLEKALWVDNFTPGEMYETRTESALYLANSLLLQYSAPMIIKTKTDTLARDSIVRTEFEFSLYGNNYSPGNSPYGVVDFCRADIA